jgi:hypothetical protein
MRLVAVPADANPHAVFGTENLLDPGAKAARQRERLGSIRDLDAAALKLKQVCAVLLDDTTSNAQVRPVVFNLVSRTELAEAIGQIDSLARPHDDQYFKELRAQHRRLRFMPALLRATSFAAAPAGKPVLEAIDYVRIVLDEKRRPGPPPTAFVPDNWMRQVRYENGTIDMTGYRLCLLDRMRAAIRRRTCSWSRAFVTATRAKDCWQARHGRRPGPQCAAHSAYRARQTRNCSSSANGSTRLSDTQSPTCQKMRAYGSKKSAATPILFSRRSTN